MNKNEKNNTIFNTMIDLLSKAHNLTKVEISTHEISETIQNYDRKRAIQLLAKYIEKYENILNNFAIITGRHIIYQPNFYADKTDEIILCDLKYIRSIIYYNEIKNVGLEIALKKILKQLNII